MAGNNYYFQGNSIADSLNEIRLHVSSFKKYSNTLKNLTKKTETYNSQIENKLKNLTDNLMPIREQILDHYVKLKNATECIRLIKKYSDFNESLKECQKIISRDGLSSSNRNAYFQAVRNAKTSVEYFHVNAPFNSQFNDWKNLMEESLVTLRKVIDIELNNSVVVNEQKLIDNVVKWTLEAIQPNILESDVNYMDINVIENMSTVMALLYECEHVKDCVDAYITNRTALYVKTFSLFREKEKSTPTTSSKLRFSLRVSNLKRRKSSSSLHIGSSTVVSNNNEDASSNYSFENNKNYSYIMQILASFIIMFQNEIKYVNKIVPQLHINEILTSIYKFCLNQIENEVEIANNEIKNLSNSHDINNLINIIRNTLPSLTFIYQQQDIMYKFAKGSQFIMVKKQIAMFTNNLESTIVDLIQDHHKILAGEYEKNVVNIISINGVFESINQSKEFLCLIFIHKKALAYLHVKLTKRIKYVEFEDSWYSYLQSSIVTTMNVLKNLVHRSCEKMEFPHSMITALNNYEYIIDMLKSKIFVEIVPTDYPRNMIDQLENCIKSSSKDYIHYWVNLFNELTQQKDVIQSQLKDIQLYGKQLSKNKKANLKILFKNLNNSLDQISKVHEGLVIYHDRILTNIKTELRDKIIPIYNQIYSGFIDVPFSKNNKKYVKISNEDFTKLIEKLF